MPIQYEKKKKIGVFAKDFRNRELHRGIEAITSELFRGHYGNKNLLGRWWR